MHVLNVAAGAVALGASVVFLTVYTMVAPWWRTAEGRALFGVGVALGLHALPTVTGWGDTARVLAFVWSASVAVRLGTLVWNAQVVSGGRVN